jgi:Pyruvate/2-oxoacid:ferredoxin oxidoreductase delta subunit
MSGQPGLSRRALLGLFRRPRETAGVAAPPRESPSAVHPAPPPAFSLESFYASRARSGEATVDGRIPLFSLREGLIVPQRVPEEDGGPARASRPVPADASGAPPREAPRTSGPPVAPPGPGTASAPGARREAAKAPALGATVRVRTGLCLAWQGSFCTTCVERCPVEGALVLEAGRPRVVAERCDGCGTCVRVCPAPLNAFELRPAGALGATS